MYRNESGRSMIEILAVMAVVGVLTIGGIAGYRHAMDKNAENAEIQIVNQFLVLCKARKQADAAGDCSAVLDELDLDEDLYDSYEKPDTGEFGIIITDVPQKVCAQLVALNWENVTISKAEGVTLYPLPDAAGCGETTTMAFSDSSTAEVCASGTKCGATCCENANSTCSGEACLLANGCPEGMPLKDTGTGRCHACDTPIQVAVSSSAAGCTGVCPGRSWGLNVCVLCPEGMTLNGYYCSRTCDAGTTFVCNSTGKQFCKCCPSDKPKLANDECVAATTACSSVSGCPAGQFCNYGGASGSTPNVCMPINPQTAEVGGTTYFFNTLTDLMSWCRGADNQINCVWGYLARSGAQSWCAGLGKSLMTSAELVAAADGLRDILPRGGSGPHMYWTSNGAVNLDTKSIDPNRPDGYAWKGGVVCK